MSQGTSSADGNQNTKAQQQMMMMQAMQKPAQKNNMQFTSKESVIKNQQEGGLGGLGALNQQPVG